MPNEDPASRQKKLEEAKRQSRINTRSTWMTFALMAILGSITYYIITSSKTSVYELTEGDRKRNIFPIELHAYKLNLNDEFVPVGEHPDPGEVLAFKLSTIRPVHVSLGLSVNGGPPQIVFEDAKIPPGPQRLFEKSDVLYRYGVRPEDAELLFCLIHSDDPEKIIRLGQSVESIWGALPPEVCARFRR